jgi:hypothetical protein
MKSALKFHLKQNNSTPPDAEIQGLPRQWNFLRGSAQIPFLMVPRGKK